MLDWPVCRFSSGQSLPVSPILRHCTSTRFSPVYSPPRAGSSVRVRSRLALAPAASSFPHLPPALGWQAPAGPASSRLARYSVPVEESVLAAAGESGRDDSHDTLASRDASVRCSLVCSVEAATTTAAILAMLLLLDGAMQYCAVPSHYRSDFGLELRKRRKNVE